MATLQGHIEIASSLIGMSGYVSQNDLPAWTSFANLEYRKALQHVRNFHPPALALNVTVTWPASTRERTFTQLSASLTGATILRILDYTHENPVVIRFGRGDLIDGDLRPFDTVRILGETIAFDWGREPTTARTWKIWYVPAYADLVSLTDQTNLGALFTHADTVISYGMAKLMSLSMQMAIAPRMEEMYNERWREFEREVARAAVRYGMNSPIGLITDRG